MTIPRDAPRSSIVAGTTLDHFEVLELLGAGGFGEVYRARDTRLERMVAIKILPEDFLGGEETRTSKGPYPRAEVTSEENAAMRPARRRFARALIRGRGSR